MVDNFRLRKNRFQSFSRRWTFVFSDSTASAVPTCTAASRPPPHAPPRTLSLRVCRTTLESRGDEDRGRGGSSEVVGKKGKDGKREQRSDRTHEDLPLECPGRVNGTKINYGRCGYKLSRRDSSVEGVPPHRLDPSVFHPQEGTRHPVDSKCTGVGVERLH